MFVFSDPPLLKATIAAKQRGVRVRVMLNAERRDGERNNQLTRKALQRAGVEGKDANPAFDLTHEKSMVVDERSAFVKLLNWATKNLTETRDYAVITDHKRDVTEVVDGFEADWHHETFSPRKNSHLIWCPGLGRDRICEFIDEAKHKLFIQNERHQDPAIIERLVRAERRRVKVHLMARPGHSLKRDKLVEGVGGLRVLDDLGVKIHKLKHLKLHGKMLLAEVSPPLSARSTLPPGASRIGENWHRGPTHALVTTPSRGPNYAAWKTDPGNSEPRSKWEGVA